VILGSCRADIARQEILVQEKIRLLGYFFGETLYLGSVNGDCCA